MRKPAVAVFATVVSFSFACGDGVTPTAATPTSGTTTPVVVATPTPTPAPTPTPVVLGQGLACGLPVMPECGQPGDKGLPPGNPPGVWGCCTVVQDTTENFRTMIGQAITTLKQEQPGLFGAGNTVLDEPAYSAGVARIVERDFKVCAKPGGPHDEIAIKTTNSYSEQYDIYTQFGTAFNPPGYQVTCSPARF
jgi:hypothetical protein